MNVVGMERVARNLHIHGSRLMPIAQLISPQGYQHRTGGDIGLGVQLEAVRRYKQKNTCE